MRAQGKSEYDAIVIGAGLTGMHQLYRLRQLGLSVRGIDNHGDVGGTWNMNRYPGCRLDSESYTYVYSFLKDLLQEWNWTEEFESQPRIMEYFSRAAEKMDVRKDIQFNTQVEKAFLRRARQPLGDRARQRASVAVEIPDYRDGTALGA